MTDWKTKRFWKQAHVEQRDTGFAVLLDTRILRTPSKSELLLPNAEMARAVAQEWDAQTGEIDPLTMPFTRSANSAIDKVAPQHGDVADLIAAYGGTDLICYRADTPQELIDRQNIGWDPLISWAKSHLKAPLITATGVMHVAQPTVSMQTLKSRVLALSNFELTGFHDLVGLSGSLIIGFAAIEGFMTPESLWTLSRIDEQWQQDLWGEDEEASLLAATKRDGFLHAFRFFELTR